MIRIAPEPPDSAAAVRLIGAMTDELNRRYGTADVAVTPVSEYGPPAGGFFVAYVGDQAAGIGAFRRLDARTAEVRRMYTAPDFRRQGVSRVLLAAVEAQARQLGYRRLTLETGTRQPEAQSLYLAAGFTLIDRYPPYDEDPTSVCFEKPLA
ncbi:MAG: GNAT family N-acetyltransferase [Candidatus Dormibacteraceae bacterium]